MKPVLRDVGSPEVKRNYEADSGEDLLWQYFLKKSGLAGQHRKFCKRFSVKLMELANKTGSRSRNGNVPNANWNDGKFHVNVNWYNPDNANANLRGRQIVLAKSSS